MEAAIRHDLENLLHVALSALLDSPQDAAVISVETEGTISFQVTPKLGKFGQICGDGGKNIESVRTLLIALAKKNRVTVHIDLVDPDPSRRKRR